MSDLSRTVEILFQGVDSISDVLDGISRRANSFGSDLQDIGEPFAAGAEKVAILDTAILGLAAAGIAASADIETEANKMKNSLGLPIEEAERFKDIALDVYSGGYGDDLAAAFDSVTLAQKKLGDNAEVDIGKVTEQALALQKTFEVDVNDSLGSVSTLMDNFGITSEQAFDFIASGFQKGLDGSGDFLDSINEYATQFSNGGADAEQFFSVLDSGFSEGVIGTDKAADMFKEFTIRIKDDSKATQDALRDLGIDPEEFQQKMASGEMSAIEAFETIQNKLGEVEDSNDQFNAGVALMGTQFEDMGATAALAVSSVGTSIDDLNGKMNEIDTKTFQENFESAIRTITTSFGDMQQWDEAKDKIANVFGDIADNFKEALGGVDLSELESKIEIVWNKLADIFKSNDLDLTTIEGMQNAINMAVESIESLVDVTSGMVDIISPAFDYIKNAVTWFNDLSPAVKETSGEVMAIGTALTVLGGIVSVGGSLLGGLGTLAGFFGSGGALATGARLLGENFTALSKFQQIGAIAISFKVGWEIGGALREYLDLDEPVQKAIREIDKVINFTGTMGEVDLGDFKKEQEIEFTANVEKANQALTDFFSDIDDQEITIQADIANEQAVSDFFGDLDDFEGNYKAVLEADTSDLDTAMDDIETLTYEVDGKTYTMDVKANADSVDDAKNEIDTIPTEKEMEIKLQDDIDKDIELIKQTGETARDAFKYTAEVEIAQAQASADILKSAFDSAGESVSALAESTGEMFSSLVGNWNNLDLSAQWDFMDILEDQQEAQDKILDAQAKLLEAQADYMDAKTDAMSSGNGLIKIDSTGLEPALEMVMWEILKKVQIRASEEAASFLLGLGA